MANRRNKGLVQGTYDVKNKDKYVGTKNPRYLSSYELQFFLWADNNKNILKWGAESVIVPYYDPVREKKRRYIVDVYIKYQTKSGSIREEIIEIKPMSQTQPPVKGKRKAQHVFESEQQTYITNLAKWEAAKQYAQERGWKFRVITEYNIFKK